jgi:hypothetical protein
VDSTYFVMVFIPVWRMLCWLICAVLWSLGLRDGWRWGSGLLSIGFYLLFLHDTGDIAFGLGFMARDVLQALGLAFLVAGSAVVWRGGRRQSHT